MGDDLIDREAALRAIQDVVAMLRENGLTPMSGDFAAAVLAIRALSSATQAGGWMPPEDRRVKPLVFSEFREGGCIGRPHPFQYFITQSHDGRFLCHWDETWHETLLAAQEHAQINYQTAAFAPLPPAPEGEW